MMKTGQNGRPVLTILMCNLFLSLTVVFFSPLEVLMANAGEFFPPFGNVWWIQLLSALAAALILAGFMLLLPGRAGLISAGISFSLGLAAYIQILFLNGDMVALTGDKMSILQSQTVLNLCLWVAVVAGTVFAAAFFGQKHRKGTETVLRAVSAALILMQLAGFASSLLTRDLAPKHPEHTLTTEGEFELSREQNAVVYVLDTADGVFVREMLDRYPELYESLSGWIWYPNATSRFSRTYPALPYMLTGNDCNMGMPVSNTLNQVYEDSLFLKNMNGEGCDCRVFTWSPELVSDKADPWIANSSAYQFGSFSNLNLPGLETSLLKVALYKCLPYCLKDAFSYTMQELNTASFNSLNDPDSYFAYLDPDFMYDLEDEPLTVSDSYRKAFRFYHFFGTHPGADWDENLEPLSDEEGEEPADVDYPAALRGCFRNVEEFIRQMKKLGVYEDATIIITADHGLSGDVGPGEPLGLQQPACPVMMVKYPRSDLSKPLQVDRAPVSQDEIFTTVEKGLGIPVTGTGSGKSFNDYSEGDSRERIHFHTAIRHPENSDIALMEYLINGDAEDFSSWHYTGRWRDVEYSLNRVSPEKIQ